LQFASLLGPALAGILGASVGGAFALLIDAMSFLLMGILAFTDPEGMKIVDCLSCQSSSRDDIL
jgi:hypothetical protein